MEMALSLRPESEEDDLRLTDQRYQKIAPLAVQRIRFVIEQKDYFLNQSRETGKANRQKAKERKAQLFWT